MTKKLNLTWDDSVIKMINKAARLQSVNCHESNNLQQVNIWSNKVFILCPSDKPAYLHFQCHRISIYIPVCCNCERWNNAKLLILHVRYPHIQRHYCLLHLEDSHCRRHSLFQISYHISIVIFWGKCSAFFNGSSKTRRMKCHIHRVNPKRCIS